MPILTRVEADNKQKSTSGLHCSGMFWVTCIRRSMVLVALTTIIGCARPAGEIFPVVEPQLVWPLAPDTPRIMYVGQLRTSADLQPAKSGWQVMKDALRSRRNRAIPITTPHAVAIGHDGRVYVTDPGSAALHVIDLAQRTHRRVDTAGDQRLRSPVGVAVGRDGVYVSDAALGDILEFDFDGNYRRRFDADLERPAGIAYCSENRLLYVIDTAAHRCISFNEEGEVVSAFGERGTGPGMFNFPTHIACSRLLGVVVSDTLNFRVQRFNLDGTFAFAIGGKGDGAGDFSLPKGLAVDSDGNLYVVDAHFENVQVFNSDGRLLLAFGNEGVEPGRFSIPAGIAIDRNDRIFVADAHNHRLQVFRYLSGSAL